LNDLEFKVTRLYYIDAGKELITYTDIV